MKSIIIGDIHGCLKTLKQLFNNFIEDTVYSVGDLIDKGPDAALVLDFVKENNIKAVKGNHEKFFEIFIPRYLDGEDIKGSKWYTLWGGKETIDSYQVYPKGKRKEKMLEHLKFIRSLPYFYILDTPDENGRKCLITHGFGLPYADKLENIDSKVETAISCNRLFGPYFDIEKEKDELYKYNLFNVFGHDAFVDVYKDDLFYGIDTGCAYGKTDKQGGKLTAFVWETKEIVSIDVKDNVGYVFEGE